MYSRKTDPPQNRITHFPNKISWERFFKALFSPENPNIRCPHPNLHFGDKITNVRVKYLANPNARNWYMSFLRLINRRCRYVKRYGHSPVSDSWLNKWRPDTLVPGCLSPHDLIRNALMSSMWYNSYRIITNTFGWQLFVSFVAYLKNISDNRI